MCDIPDGGYPGWYVHQLEARKISMLLLHAMDEALEKWVAGISELGFPLDVSYWHVGEKYEERVRVFISLSKQSILVL